jgi:hypothetical protein
VHRYLKLKTQLTLVLEHWTHEMEASSPFIGFITQKWSTKKSTTPNWTMFIHVYGWYMAGNHQPTWVTGRVGPRVGPPTWCHPLPGAKRRCSWSLTWASSQVEFRGKMRRNQWILLSHDGSMVLLYIYYYMVTWIPSIYTLFVGIYTIHGSYGYRMLIECRENQDRPLMI